MKTDKKFIKNRLGSNICVSVDLVKNHEGIVVLMHGLGDNKNLSYIMATAKVFNEMGVSVIRFDATHSFGESDGDFAKATIEGYCNDLEDVVHWSRKQRWFVEPLFLCGHSLGGYAVAKYAQNHPEKIKAIILISPIVSGKLKSPDYDDELVSNWRRLGYKETGSLKNPKNIKRLNWSYYESRLQADLLADAEKLLMPTLIIVGDNDTTTPLFHQKQLYKILKCHKKLHIIKDAGHSFRSEHQIEVACVIKNWINFINKK